jgi:hypothetical protein
MPRRYGSVNGAWPPDTNDGRDLKPTPQEAMSAARRLYRLGTGRAFRGRVRLTSGNRYTWVRRHVLYVNPDCRRGGWHELVHDLSHYCHRKVHPRNKPHAGTHAWIERNMIQHVVESGWLDGKLKRPAKEKPDVRQVRQKRVLAAINKWEAKRKRAETALKKLRRQARYYEKKAPGMPAPKDVSQCSATG